MDVQLIIDTLIITLVAFIMVVGLFGAVLPVVPGLLLIWLAGWLYGVLTYFGPVGWVVMGLMTIFMVVGYAGGFFLPQAGGAVKGASFWAVVASFVLGVIGFFVIPVLGLPIGAVLGIYLVEYYRAEKDSQKAWETTKGVLLGFGIGVAVELGSGFVMVGLWLVWMIVNLYTVNGTI